MKEQPMNIIQLDVQISKPPKPLQTKKGEAMAALDLAYIGAGDKPDKFWIRGVAFKRPAEDALLYRAGDRVRVSGRLQNRRYKDREGAYRDDWTIVIDEISPLKAATKTVQDTSPEDEYDPFADE